MKLIVFNNFNRLPRLMKLKAEANKKAKEISERSPAATTICHWHTIMLLKMFHQLS